MSKIRAVFLKKLGENNFEVYATKKIGKKHLKITVGRNAVKEKHTENIEKKKQNNGVYEKIGQKKIKNTDDIISFENKTFLLPKGIFSLKRGKILEIFYDYDNEKILCFKEHSTLVSAKMLDRFLSKNIIAQLMSKLRNSMENPDKTSVLRWIFVGGIMFAVGFMAHAMI